MRPEVLDAASTELYCGLETVAKVALYLRMEQVLVDLIQNVLRLLRVGMSVAALTHLPKRLHRP